MVGLPGGGPAASRRRKWLVRLAILCVLGVAFALRNELPSIDYEGIIRGLAERLGSWTYLLVGALAFLETGAFVGLIAPGEFTVILGGAVAGQGEASLPLMIAVTWICAFAGDSVSFALGTRLGRGFLERHGPRFRITPDRLQQVEAYFEKHGGKTILIGRFIGLVRALAPFIAGSSAMRYAAFAPYSILGTGIWATGLVLIGYFASQSIDAAAGIVGRGLIGFGILVGIVVAVLMGRRWLREPANRDRLLSAIESNGFGRLLLAGYRKLGPQIAFLRARLTPGGLGLELTTLLAALAVSLFVFVSYWAVVAGDPGPTPGDTTAYDLSVSLQAGWLDSFAEALTALGSSYVTLAVAGLAAFALIATGKRAETGVLLFGVAVSFLAVPELKEAVGRPRPPDPVISVSGPDRSFPSGHATHAVIYTWLAVTIAFRLVPSFTHRGLVIAAGVVLTALVGLTRVYLRVHWLSDVSAGWALGVASFALAGAVALVAVHIRDNPRKDGT